MVPYPDCQILPCGVLSRLLKLCWLTQVVTSYRNRRILCCDDFRGRNDDNTRLKRVFPLWRWWWHCLEWFLLWICSYSISIPNIRLKKETQKYLKTKTTCCQMAVGDMERNICRCQTASERRPAWYCDTSLHSQFKWPYDYEYFVCLFTLSCSYSKDVYLSVCIYLYSSFLPLGYYYSYSKSCCR